MTLARRAAPAGAALVLFAAASIATALPGCSTAEDEGFDDPLADLVLVPSEASPQGACFLELTEVTNAAFAKFLRGARHRSDDPGFLLHWRRPAGGDLAVPAGLESHPVVHVSPLDAQAYARWRKRRLPTAGEWDAAAGFGVDGGYPFGLYLPLRANTLELGLGHTTPVGIFENGRSLLGFYDLAGNVAEFTTTPAGVVLKGGSFSQFARRVDPKESEAPVGDRFSSSDAGFRCAADALPLLRELVAPGVRRRDAQVSSLAGLIRRSGAAARALLEEWVRADPSARAVVDDALVRAK